TKLVGCICFLPPYFGRMRRTAGKHRISDRRRVVGRHRRPIERTWLWTREGLRRAGRSRAALATSALTCLALATMAGQAGASESPTALVASTASNRGVVAEVVDAVTARTETSAKTVDRLELFAAPT